MWYICDAFKANHNTAGSPINTFLSTLVFFNVSVTSGKGEGEFVVGEQRFMLKVTTMQLKE
jgi:hypothetical protein